MPHYDLVFTATIHSAQAPPNKFLYVDLTAVDDYVVVAGDSLEYEVYWGNAGAKIAVDLVCSDGAALRTSTALDQEGRAAHPNTALPELIWHTRTIPLTALLGKTVQHYLLGCEADAGGTHRAHFRSVRIMNGITVKRTVWEITDSDPASAIYLTDTAGANSYTLARATNTRPSTPKSVTVTALSHSSLRVQWTDTTDYGDPGWTVPEWWDLELSLEPTFAAPQRFTVSPAATVQCDVTGLDQDRRYYARVRGANVWFYESGWAVLRQEFTQLLLSNRLRDAAGAPISGKAVLVPWDALVNWSAGNIAITALQNVVSGELSLTAAGSGQPLALLTFENAANPTKAGNVYRSISEAVI